MARTKRTTRTARTVRTTRKTLDLIKSIAIAKARQARAAIDNGTLAATSRAAKAVGSFEKVFEDRVGRAIGKLGVPTARDVRALSRQVAHLQQSVDQLRRARARA